jgi:hypothetical protein
MLCKPFGFEKEMEKEEGKGFLGETLSIPN